MSNYTPNQSALLVRSHRFSLIWIIPLIAAIATGWLGWRSYVNRGTEITISFPAASGIEAGKTKIKYKDGDFGIVDSVEPTKDLSRFIITAHMTKAAEPYLTKTTRFWVVKPGSRDLSLGALISGAYIEFAPSTGDSARHFDGEQSPAFVPPEEAGETYMLHAAQLGSIQQGSLVYYRGMNVGRVLGYTLLDKEGSAEIQIFINAQHTNLIHTGTRFWNTSGISVIVGSNGLKIQLESIQSLVSGGIAFGISPNTQSGEVAKAGAAFTLYPDQSSAEDSVYTQRVSFLLHFNNPVPGINIGSVVRMQGITVGQVKELHMEYDSHSNHLSIPVIIEVETDRIKLLNNIAAPTTQENDPYAIFRKLIASGLRARVSAANMLTGQKLIELDVIPNTPPLAMIESKPHPEIPTLDANDVDAVIGSAKELLGKLQVTASTLNAAISDKEDGGDLAGTLREFKNAARSIRVLTDYLENHPEAILRGKPKDPKP